MDRAGQRRRSLTRALLLGLGTAGAWFVLSLLSPAPASADDGDEGGGGLLGVAQGVVHGVTGTADHVVGGVAEHVPVLEPAAPVVSSTAEVVDTVVDTATGAVATVVDTAPVGSVVAPVLDAVDAVTGGIPVVAEVVDRSGIMPVVTDTVAAVDTTVTEVVVGDAPDAAPARHRSGARRPRSLLGWSRARIRPHPGAGRRGGHGDGSGHRSDHLRRPAQGGSATPSAGMDARHLAGCRDHRGLCTGLHAALTRPTGGARRGCRERRLRVVDRRLGSPCRRGPRLHATAPSAGAIPAHPG